jgi:hypothetical protein
MNNKPSRLYTILVIGAVIAVVIMVYLLVGTYFNVPLTSLLPFTSTIQPTQPAGKKLTSVKEIAMSNGQYQYVISGKFVTTPEYNRQNILQSDFVIDGDPRANRIPVYMTAKTGKISVGKAPDATFNKIVWAIIPTEELRKAIHLNVPAQLRTWYSPKKNTIPILSVFHNALEQIMSGEWNMPPDFYLTPTDVVVMQ